eukprot:6377000-Amphidinium_carterae.1
MARSLYLEVRNPGDPSRWRKMLQRSTFQKPGKGQGPKMNSNVLIRASSSDFRRTHSSTCHRFAHLS